MTLFGSKKLSYIHHELHSNLPSEPALRTKALESLLTEKKLLDAAAIDAWIEMYRDEIGPKRGAAVIARAWTDPGFKKRLLANGTSAIAELGFAGHATAISRRSKTHHRFTISSYAHCALVIPFRCSACRRPGTNPTNTVRGLFETLEACSRSSESNLTRRHRCASGTQRRNDVTSSCRRGPLGSTL